MIEFPPEGMCPTNNAELRDAIYEVFGGVDFYTGRPMPRDGMHIDHIVPKSMGGEDNVFNYVPTTRDMNTAKGVKFDMTTAAPLLHIVRIHFAPKIMARLLAKKWELAPRWRADPARVAVRKRQRVESPDGYAHVVASTRGGKPCTFALCAEGYFIAYRGMWAERHAIGWTQCVRDYINPVIGGIRVDEVTTDHVVRVIEPIWTVKTETANRALSRIRAVLSWAADKGLRSGDNPAQWRGKLDGMFESRKQIAPAKALPSLHFEQIPDFVRRLRVIPDVGARALLFTILTGVRSGEGRGAKWGEINTEKMAWEVPASRMKAGVEHCVPLSGRVLLIIGDRPSGATDEDLVFQSTRKGRKSDGVISNMTFGNILRSLGGDALTTHGFRTTFREWAADAGYADHVIDACLSLSVRIRDDAGYMARHAERRRKLMEEWAEYCLSASLPELGRVA